MMNTLGTRSRVAKGGSKSARGNTQNVITSLPVVNPASGLNVDAAIEGMSVAFLLDTGTTVMLSKDTWELLCEENCQKLSLHDYKRLQSWWE